MIGGNSRIGAPLETMRRLLLALVALGMAGSITDLVLLEHYEDLWQWPPLAIMGLGILAIAWLLASGGGAAVAALRVVMVLTIGAGVLGVLLHYNGNREFQLEMDPSLAGWALFTKVMTAKAPPALAPGSMIQLGLLGLLATYRHPALRGSTSRTGA